MTKPPTIVNSLIINILLYQIRYIVDYEKMYYIVHTPLVRYYQTWYELVLTGNLLLLGNQELTISTECTKLMNT